MKRIPNVRAVDRLAAGIARLPELKARRLEAQVKAEDSALDDRERALWASESDSVSDEYDNLIDSLLNMPVRSLAGFRLKAQLLRDRFDFLEPDDGRARWLIDDLACQIPRADAVRTQSEAA